MIQVGHLYPQPEDEEKEEKRNPLASAPSGQLSQSKDDETEDEGGGKERK